MKILKPASLILTVIFSLDCHAFDPSSSIQVSRTNNNGTFFAGGEYATLTSPNETLSGVGVQAGYQYTFNGRWSFDGSFSQIFGSGNGVTALYSGISIAARWAPFKEFATGRSDIRYDGSRIFEETSNNDGVWAIGPQLNQLFLNGVTSVYNATGLGLVVSYQTRMWGRSVRPEFRYASMTANDASLSGMFANLVILF